MRASIVRLAGAWDQGQEALHRQALVVPSQAVREGQGDLEGREAAVDGTSRSRSLPYLVSQLSACTGGELFCKPSPRRRHHNQPPSEHRVAPNPVPPSADHRLTIG